MEITVFLRSFGSGDFTWAGKAVGGFIVLFGVSIVVVPMSVAERKDDDA
jgi:hypothetical protein